MNLAALFAQLHAESLVRSPEVPELPPLPAPAPWYTRAMLGFAGWFAGLFIVLFFGSAIVLLFKDGPGMLLLAAALCGAAVAIDRKSRNDLTSQFALALSMAGQAFFAFGLGQLLDTRGGAWSFTGDGVAWGMVALQAVLFVAMHSSLHRVWSVVVAAACLHYLLHKHGAAGAVAGVIAVGFAVIWAREEAWRVRSVSPRRRPGPNFIEPLGWGLALALIAWNVPSFLERPAAAVRILETAGYGAGLLVYAAIATRRAATRERVLALMGAGLLAIAAHPAPGIVAGTLVLVAGYGSGQRSVAALGVAGILGYLAAYYYQLDQTLLAKAGALAVTGLTLLAARFVLARFTGEARP